VDRLLSARSLPRFMDAAARMRNRKDCDEVFPGIIVGNGDCIKDVRREFDPSNIFLPS
jgi:hypothetical protein